MIESNVAHEQPLKIYKKTVSKNISILEMIALTQPSLKYDF